MAVSGSARVEGGRELAAALRTGADQIDQLVPVVVIKSATDLTVLTQKNASNRPGPNAPTGDYRGSWRVEVNGRRASAGATEVSAAVGTDRAQANRLEYGFVGRDSLGREYDQSPYPHHGPAIDVIEPLFEAAMEKVAEKAIPW